MKNFFHKLIFTLSTILFFSCVPDNEKFNGTPTDNNLEIETIIGTVATNSTFALPGQLIDFNVTLPQDFVSKVNTKLIVEAVTETTGGSLRKGYITLNPGQNTGSGTILVGGGGGIFSMPVSLKLNSVSLENAFSGKQFLLTSEKVSIDSGDTSVPPDSDNKIQIKIAWEGSTSGNPISCNVLRENSSALTLKGNNWPAGQKVKVGGTDYPIVFSTDLATTALNFKMLHGTTILAEKGITVTVSGKALLFDYGASGVQPILISPFPTPSQPNPPTTYGVVYNGGTLITGTNLKFKSFLILNKQPTSRSSFESVESGFNEGTYVFSIKPTGPLEPNTTDLKYRIIVKLPNGTVKIYNGIYSNISANSPEKNVFKFTKTVLGDVVDYKDFLQL